MYSINHHLVSIRVVLESLPALGYTVHDELKRFLQLDPMESNQALNLHQALNFYRSLRQCYPDSGLALKIAQVFPPQIYGMFGFGLMSSASAREALNFAVRFQKLSYTLMTLSVDFGPRTSRLCFSTNNLNIENDLAAFFADRDMASIMVPFRMQQRALMPALYPASEPEVLSSAAMPIEKVTLVHDGYGAAELYRQYFPCEVEFLAPVSSIVYKTSELDHPSLFRNTGAFAICERECDKQLAIVSEDSDISSRVRQELLIRPGYLQDIESISGQLNLSARTLRRRLSENASSFQQLQQEVRYEQAKEYLDRSGLSIGEVSELLGFSEPGNFTQAFKRWSGGQSPMQFRKSSVRTSEARLPVSGAVQR